MARDGKPGANGFSVTKPKPFTVRRAARPHVTRKIRRGAVNHIKGFLRIL
jgi:hypothetical protein